MVRGKREEKGFALIAALLVMWVLTALGMLVFSVTTQDVRVSSRTVGERKAFSAAESGVHSLTQNFDAADPGKSKTSVPVPVDASGTGDPKTMYSISATYSDKDGKDGWVPTKGPVAVSMAGYAIGGGETWGRQRFLVRATGTNASYNSTVQLDVGVGYGPVDISTLYR